MYTLRALQESDIELVQSWLAQEYIAKWFGEASEWMDEINGRHKEYSFIRHFIAMQYGQPIGFAQYYHYANVSHDPQDEGTYGIDYAIGDRSLLGQGIGKQLVQLICHQVLEDNSYVTCIVADPAVEDGQTNIASVKVLEANHFIFDAHTGLYRKRAIKESR